MVSSIGEEVKGLMEPTKCHATSVNVSEASNEKRGISQFKNQEDNWGTCPKAEHDFPKIR